jgi:hypothetical protein
MTVSKYSLEALYADEFGFPLLPWVGHGSSSMPLLPGVSCLFVERLWDSESYHHQNLSVQQNLFCVEDE